MKKVGTPTTIIIAAESPHFTVVGINNELDCERRQNCTNMKRYATAEIANSQGMLEIANSQF